MPALPGSRPFFESTRGRVVECLRRGPATVEELAAALELTDNAIRAHLATLERDGMVRTAGVRREGTVGKPATEFALSADAESALSRGYAPFVRALVAALSRRMPRRGIGGLFRDVGRRLAAGRSPAVGSLKARAERAAAALRELGGSATVDRHAEGYCIRGGACPLSDAVREEPEVCVSVAAMLRELTGVPVHRDCEHGDRPSCRFIMTEAQASPPR